MEQRNLQMQMLTGGGVIPEQTLGQKEEDEDGETKNLEPNEYYTLNLHVKEMRQPKHSEEPLSPGRPCENYNRYYLPNG